PVRVYFVCSILRGLYCLKVFSFQLMKNCGASTLKLMGMYTYPKRNSQNKLFPMVAINMLNLVVLAFHWLKKF
ncbi:hypothetical protein ACQVTQ_29720, partial [Bacillus mycoides]